MINGKSKSKNFVGLCKTRFIYLITMRQKLYEIIYQIDMNSSLLTANSAFKLSSI